MKNIFFDLAIHFVYFVLHVIDINTYGTFLKSELKHLFLRTALKLEKNFDLFQNSLKFLSPQTKTLGALQNIFNVFTYRQLTVKHRIML